MNMFELLLPDPGQVKCDHVSIMADDRRVLLQLTAVAEQSTCPVCTQKTSKVHSRYSRHLVDLPWADVPVSICLEVRRFFCRNDGCPRVIFCERLPGVVAPWARRTKRLAKAQRAIGLALGGAAGARLSALLMMTAGIDLLLSLIRRIARSENQTPRVLVLQL
jgi:transposase